MIKKARDYYPSLTFQVGDAENLAEFTAGSFDAAGMNFGMLHLSNPEKALRELHRVLTPASRAAFTVWRKSEAVAFSLVLDEIEKHGNPHVPLPQGPAFFQYSEAAACERLLQTCGFTCQVETLQLTWKLTDADEVFQAFYHGTARTGGLLHRQQPGDLAKIREAVCEAAKEYLVGGEIVIPMPAQLAWGMK
jgi:ubiquinone/menaquinone biosynthesis C-methylase UbiE